MEIEVRKLNSIGKYAGEFDFDYLPDNDLSLIPLCRIEGDVKVSGSYEIYDDDSVGVTLTVKYLLAGQCSYCLKSAKKDISFTSEILYVPKEDDENYLYDGIKINLKTAVDDAILISQPNVLLCSEGCKGIDVDNN